MLRENSYPDTVGEGIRTTIEVVRPHLTQARAEMMDLGRRGALEVNERRSVRLLWYSACHAYSVAATPNEGKRIGNHGRPGPEDGAADEVPVVKIQRGCAP